MKRLTLLLLVAACSLAEPRTLTLKEAVDLALRQNPDVLVARLDQQRATLEVSAVKEPLLPRVVVGSGLAYTSGFPMSIEGSAPSIIQAKAIRSLYNPQQDLTVAQTRETARGTAFSTERVRENAALRTALLFLDLERTFKELEIARRQVENLSRVEAAVRLRVSEGRELAIEGKRAGVDTAHGRQRVQVLEGNRTAYSRALARVLGMDPNDEITPSPEERKAPILPETEEASVAQALSNSSELKQIQSDLLAKGYESKAFKAGKLPRVDLVAQYGLFAKFNNYEQFFNTFQRNNGQIGASIQIPFFNWGNYDARAAQSNLDAEKIKIQYNQTRGRIESDTRQGWQKVRDAETESEVAKMDLDLAREQVGVILSQSEEGRATIGQLEEARFQENERWLKYFDARYGVERARLELLGRTGMLEAQLR
jgi:outer membrane protein